MRQFIEICILLHSSNILYLQYMHKVLVQLNRCKLLYGILRPYFFIGVPVLLTRVYPRRQVYYNCMNKLLHHNLHCFCAAANSMQPIAIVLSLRVICCRYNIHYVYFAWLCSEYGKILLLKKNCFLYRNQQFETTLLL